MVRDKDRALRFEEVVIRAGSVLIDVALKDSSIRRDTRALIVAMRGEDGVFSYNPEPTIVMREGWTLVAIGEPDNIRKLRALAGEPSPVSRLMGAS